MLTEWKDLSREVNVQLVEAISEEIKCEWKGKNGGGLGQAKALQLKELFWNWFPNHRPRKKKISYKKEQGAQQIE
jgi:hypothetical protein